MKNKVNFEELFKEIPVARVTSIYDESLPWDFLKWVNSTALLDSRYLYYENKMMPYYEDGKKTAYNFATVYCTHCKSESIVLAKMGSGTLHRKQGICKHCKTKATYIYRPKGNYIKDETRVSVICNVTGGIGVRYFKITKNYYSHYESPTVECEETHRMIILENGKRAAWEWGFENWNNYKLKWKRQKDPKNVKNWNATLYTRNVKNFIKNTVWKYSGVYEFARIKERFPEHKIASFEKTCSPYVAFRVEDYLAEYLRSPCLEYLSKMGLSNLVLRCLPYLELTGMGFTRVYPANSATGYFNPSGRNIGEVLPGIDKREMKIVCAVDAMESTLKIISFLKLNDIVFNEKQLRVLMHFGSDYWNSDKAVIERMLNYAGVNSVCNFLSRQIKLAKDTGLYACRNILRDWNDYFNAAIELDLNVNKKHVVLPKNFKLAHDRTIARVKIMENSKYNEMIKNRYKESFEKYSFEDNNLFIAIPTCSEDIIKEGESLGHCVGNYCKSVAKGTTNILFIRKKTSPSKPCFTMEVRNNGEVVQVRGSHNSGMDKETLAFVERFKQEKLRKQPKNIAV